MNGFFIVGTDTHVGKTWVAAGLLRAYAALGLRVIGMKPVAAGAVLQDGVWVNEDVALLTAASTVRAPAASINPYLFREAIAPHLAAMHKGVRIEIPRIRAACETLMADADVVVVEGVGGLLVPLSARQDAADLAVALGLPLILVVGMRLGCLSHALLTAEVIASRGLKLAGWVANRIDPEMRAYEENLDALVSRIPAPLLASMPFLPACDAERMAAAFVPRRLAGLLAGH